MLAVDPSSPLTGGAILGDRVRMAEATASGVFIRSMATRGHAGGLALAVPGMVRVLELAGFDPVVVETVGVGQVEVDVASAADTVLVVVTPGMGDAVQANKAGLLEVADLFAVNKSDRPDAADVRRDLELMLDLSDLTGHGRWRQDTKVNERVPACGRFDGGHHRGRGGRTGRRYRRSSSQSGWCWHPCGPSGGPLEGRGAVPRGPSAVGNFPWSGFPGCLPVRGHRPPWLVNWRPVWSVARRGIVRLTIRGCQPPIASGAPLA
ncbi:MAG: hypothetical protein Ct9H300mP12_17600 [Acidimicrobiales bacterium]|nr:MAG: hypothetical protein Ct9H300mP12_17600 [Acidimicrobiales bacterium]